MSRSTVTVALSLLVWTVLASRLHWEPGKGLSWRAPLVSGGDEVHYMVTLFSLLEDGDLDLTDDYRAANLGGPHQGLRHRGAVWDHHTFWVQPETCEVDRWWNFYDFRQFLGTCEGPKCTPFREKKPVPPGAIERPLHPAGFPLLLAAILWPFRLDLEHVESATSVVVLVMSWLSFLLVYLVARREGWSAGWSLLPTLLIACASPNLPYVKSYFTEPALALALLAGLYTLRRDQPVLAGLAIGAAVCIKPNFGLIGATWVLVLLAIRAWPAAARLTLSLGAVVALGYLAFTRWLLCRWLLPMPDNTFWPLTAKMTAVTFWEDEHGLLVFVPWIVPVLALAISGLFTGGRTRVLVTALVLPVAISTPLFLGGPWVHPGYCYGPRYWVPYLPFLALAATASAVNAPAKLRRAMAGVLVFCVVVGAAIAIPDTLTLAEGSFAHLPLVLRWTAGD